MVHVGPFPVKGDDVLTVAYGTPYGRASVLFVVLAGAGVSLLAGDRSPGRLRAMWLRLAYRAALLFPLGLALQLLPTNVAVILQYYALFFLIAGVAQYLTNQWLLGLAVGIALIGPVLLLLAELLRPDWFDGGGNVTITEPIRLARALVLTGYYPAITWTPAILAGAWLARQDLRSTAIQRRLLVGGAAVAAAAYATSAALAPRFGSPTSETAGWARLLVAEGHSQMPLAIIGATAVATAIIGATLLLAHRFPRAAWPLAAAGQLALTIYVGQLLVLAATPEVLVRDTVLDATFTVARFALVAITLAMLWRLRFARGPLEALLRLPFSRHA